MVTPLPVITEGDSDLLRLSSLSNFKLLETQSF